MRNDKNGVCRICGKIKKLTFEHVPPECCFNTTSQKLITGETLIKHIIDGDKKPWDYSGLSYKNQQKGMGYYSLCQECNSKTGLWYGNSYKYFIHALNKLIYEQAPRAGETLNLTLKEFRPLPVFKQVISMFCSVNENLRNDVSEFLLDKQSTEFVKKYSVYMYIVNTETGRIFGFSGLCQPPNIYVVSEIAFYPVGFILSSHGDCSPYGTDITHFSSYAYNIAGDLEMCVPVHECNTTIALDFRTKEEIEKQMHH